MAAALAHVHAATGAPEWLAAAQEACAHEDTQFDPQTGKLAGPQHRVGLPSPLLLVPWGAGIALARAWIGSLDPAPEIKGPGALALATTRAAPIGMWMICVLR